MASVMEKSIEQTAANSPDGTEAAMSAPSPAARQEEASVTGALRPGGLMALLPKAADADRLRDLAKGLMVPVAGILAFLALWAVLAPQVDTSLGSLPGPVEVAEQGDALYDEWSATQDAKAEFYAAQDERIAAGTQAQAFDYAGPPTFLDQIITSLKTVALGFILASIVAVPIGLVCGLSKTVNAAINPLVQIMKPVSPLAWLPIVTMVISATLSGPDPFMPKAFVISAIVVMLCSLWPTLINTAVGAASIDKDLLNVGKVLRRELRDK